MDDSAVDDMDSADPEAEKITLHDGVLPDGKDIQDIINTLEVLMKLDLDLAYSSEKMANLDIFFMHLLALKDDTEALITENSFNLADSIEKVLTFDLLSSIVDSEIREQENFVDCLQNKIIVSRQKISSFKNLGELLSIVEEKFSNSEESLKHSLEKVLEMKIQSDKLQKALLASQHRNWENDMGMDSLENEQYSKVNPKLNLHRGLHQRHILRMLEKFLAREQNLEKKLSELKQTEDELKLKLRLTEQVAFCMEEAAEVVWGRFLEAENAAEVLMGISKELVGRLHIVQFSLNSSTQREDELKSKVQDCIEQLKSKEIALLNFESSHTEPSICQPAQRISLKASLGETQENLISDRSEVLVLHERVKLLEEQLTESEKQLKSVNAYNDTYLVELSEVENITESLKESISNAESRAESAETKVAALTETNLELTEELGFLKGNDNNSEKVSLLEKKLRELEIQLQHAKASSDASQEQQNMLYSAIWDMETLIEDLKSKVSKAEFKTETAEEQCITLSEANLELNTEVNFLRTRMESLEASLHQSIDTKVATAKEINVRAKLMMDMLMQLTVERERIQEELSSLTNENKILVKKLSGRKEDASVNLHDDAAHDDKEFLFSNQDSINADYTVSFKGEVVGSSPKIFEAGG